MFRNNSDYFLFSSRGTKPISCMEILLLRSRTPDHSPSLISASIQYKGWMEHVSQSSCFLPSRQATLTTVRFEAHLNLALKNLEEVQQ